MVGAPPTTYVKLYLHIKKLVKIPKIYTFFSFLLLVALPLIVLSPVGIYIKKKEVSISEDKEI